MENFTPLSALVGGVLIGLSASLLWLTTGRVAGISGVLGGLLGPERGDVNWRLAFLAGLMAAPLFVAAATGALPTVTIAASWPTLVLGGLLVGFGTRLGGGCTSGHGVCGVARLSPRSLLATLLFMSAGATVAIIVRHGFAG
ncbi:MAG TPA: YeeE/YedE family protein [Stellaceae bacterium]|nr:YeeE/YedE family protein [Stellaceae bacterium]